MTNLDPDLQRILNTNAKVYNAKTNRQGRVIVVNEELVHVDYGNSAKPDIQDYDIDDFKQMLIDDEIVANSRLTMGDKNNFKIKPRQTSPTPNVTSGVTKAKRSASEPLVQNLPRSEVNQPLEVGYINFSDGQYSDNPRKGFTKVEYRKVIEQVTLELTSEQIDKLKEMGLMK